MGNNKRQSRNIYDQEKQKDAFKTRLTDMIDGPKTKKELAAFLGVSEEMVRLYSKGNNFPDTQNLMNIARFFNCSLDYLIGLSDVKTPEASTQAICKHTGLSESAVKYLHAMTLSKTAEDKRPLHFLNTIFSDPRITPKEERIIFDSSAEEIPRGSVAEDYELLEMDFPSSLLSYLDQYITSSAVVRKLDRDEANPLKCKSLEEYERRSAKDEREKRIVSFQTSEDMTEVFSAAELYRELMIQKIRKELEFYRGRF